MRGWLLLVCVVLLGPSWGGVPAMAAGSRDLQDGWLLPPELLVDLLGHDPRPREAGAWGAVGQARLYGLPELPLQAAVVGWRAEAWRAAVAWQCLGGVLLREDRLRAQLLFGARRAVGIAAGWDALRLGDGANRRCVELRVEVRAPGPAGCRVAGSLPLTAAPPWFGRGGARRWWSVAGTSRAVAWCVAADRDGRGAPLLETEGVWRVGAGCGLGLRWEPATGTLGLTTAWSWRGLLLRSSHLAHPELGLTHRWSLGAGPAEVWP